MGLRGRGRRAARASIVFALLLGAVSISGCFRWHQVPVAAAPASLGYVEARRGDGSSLRLARARLSSDSLHGRQTGLVRSELVAIPRASLTELKVRRLDRRRTAIASVVWVAIGAVGLTAVAPFTER